MRGKVAPTRPISLVYGRWYVCVLTTQGRPYSDDDPAVLWCGRFRNRSGLFVRIVDRCSRFEPVVFGSRLDLSRGDYLSTAFRFFEVVE